MRGYVVTRPYPESGLGSNLASLAGAAWLARRLDRELIVDWRGMVFLEDKTVNYFTEFLEPIEEIGGVRAHYAPSAEAGDHLQAPEASLDIRGSEFPQLTLDEPARYLVATSYHGFDRFRSGEPADGFFRIRDVYRQVRPRAFVQAEIDRFAGEHFAETFVVAVNIATGNMPPPEGDIYFGRFDVGIFRNQERFAARVRRACDLAVRALPRALRARRTIFCASDSSWMTRLLTGLPAAVARRAVFPPAGAGRLFSGYASLGYTDRDASVDMIADHFLLARCNALVYNNSMFSFYARAVTDFYNGNARNIETLFARYWARTARRRLPVLVRR